MSAIGVVSVNSNSTAALLTQLAAKGAQDVLLTCDPKCSLFHQSYCRITNFSMGEQTLCFQQAPSGQEWVASTAIRAEVLRAGDLLGPVYVDGQLSGLPAPMLPATQTSPNDPFLEVLLWTPAVSYALVATSQVLIGSQEFETIPSEYMIMHDEISRTEGCRASKLVGDYGPYLRGVAIACDEALDGGIANQYQGLSALGSDEDTFQAGVAFSTRSQKIIAPLPHFWTSHAGNYLNVVGSQYHNIVLQLSTRAYSQLALALAIRRETGAINPLASNLLDSGAEILDTADAFNSDMGQLSGLSILAVYVQLDTAERRLKAQAAQTVRMVYVQSTPYSTVATDQASTRSITNYFNHPVTRFLWAWRATAATATQSNQQWFRFGAFRGSRYPIAVPQSGLTSSNGYFPVQEAVPEINEFELQINNHSRTNQAAEYYLYTQPYALGKRVPSRIIYSYSFAQYPDAADMHSGSMNLSRIDNVVLNFTFKTAIGAGEVGPLPGTFRARSDSIAEPNSIQTGTGVDGDIQADQVRALSTAGTIFFCAETINFYKQAAGMFGLLFAN